MDLPKFWPQPWWSQKRIDKIWEEYWEPFVEEEVDICLAMEGRFRLHKIIDNIEWREVDGF